MNSGPPVLPSLLETECGAQCRHIFFSHFCLTVHNIIDTFYHMQVLTLCQKLLHKNKKKGSIGKLFFLHHNVFSWICSNNVCDEKLHIFFLPFYLFFVLFSFLISYHLFFHLLFRLIFLCFTDTKLNEIDKFEHKSSYDNARGYNTRPTHDKKGELNRGKYVFLLLKFVSNKISD